MGVRRVRVGAGVKGAVAACAAISLAALLAPTGAPPPAPESARAASLPPGFQETVVWSGLTNPTAVRFAADGRVFVAEKSGVIKVFNGLSDSTPTVFADLNVKVYNFWDRGLLGLAVDPQFPAQPYVYALYSYDATIGGTAPRWGTPGVYGDPCPTPPGPTSDGCVTSGRLSRLTATPSGDSYVMTGSEQVLVNDWCEQFQTHSIGTVAFGPDGALYASGGEGAGATFTDWGQEGSPLNPCGDPPGGVGAVLTPPTAEGGALRSQDLRTLGDPVGLDGTIIRVNPATGAGLPDNPLAGSSDPNARRIIAYGLRNPFRLAFRPGTSELWLGDVGGIDWEEINRIPAPSDSVVENFGWPCYEGSGHQSSFDAANFTICENLYASPGAETSPYHQYAHSDKVVPGESCPTGSSSISGAAFKPAGAPSVYPAQYNGAFFFADYSRRCIWAMKTGGGALPSPGSIETFVANAAGPVHLQFGPDGMLYYVDLDGGTIRRIEPNTSPPPPAGTNYLSDLNWTSMSNHCGPVEKDRSNGNCAAGDGQTLTLNGTTYAKGLGAHANSDVSYFLGGVCTRFKASIGLDDEVPGSNGSVTFQVYADANLVYTSPVLNGASATRTVDVSVAGATQLRLVADAGADAGWDHADWALARVECGGSGNQPPTPVIDTPAPTLTWKVGDLVTFSGHATDPEQGSLPASSLSWALVIQHCPSNCHSHTIQTWNGVAGGSFNAPDHEYPSFLELRLTATDGGGASATTTVELDPQTVALAFQSSPSGLSLSVGGLSTVTPFVRTFIVGSASTVSATTPQILNGTTYEFSSWSDAGAQTHGIVASPSVPTYTAGYVIAPPRNTALPQLKESLTYPPVLSVSTGDWSGSQPITFSYQWLRCVTDQISSCQAIAGATTPRYVLLPADSGFRLRATVIATNAGGTGSATSEATPPL